MPKVKVSQDCICTEEVEVTEEEMELLQKESQKDPRDQSQEYDKLVDKLLTHLETSKDISLDGWAMPEIRDSITDVKLFED